MQDRAERSLDHLHRKRSVIARRLLSVLPSVATGFMELRTPDDYWRETHRKVVKLWLALTEMFPEAAAGQQSGVLADTLEITSDWDEKTSMAVAQIVANPVQFLRTLSSVSNLAPFEPGYPHRSILNEYRRDYTAEIGRHIRTIERSHWVCKGPGRLLPVLLALSFMWGVLMLSISDKVSTATILWGVSLDMVLAVASLVLFSMVAGRLIQPVGTPSMQSLQRIQTRLTQ
jgi:hypothetical protein